MFEFKFDLKDFYNKHFDYFVLAFMALCLTTMVLLAINENEKNPKITEKNGRYTYIKNLDKLFQEEKDFLDRSLISNDDIYLYSLFLNINKFQNYKEKCDLNNKGDIIDFKFFNNVVGIKEKRHLYIDNKQLKNYNEKEIYGKLNSCLNYVIDDYKLNKQIIPNKTKLIEKISSEIKQKNITN